MRQTRESGVWIAVLISLLILVNSSFANEPVTSLQQYKGQALSTVIDTIRQQGYPIVYSSRLITPSMLVIAEPQSSDPIELLTEILEPHGLMLKSSDGIYLVVRNNRLAAPQSTGSLMVIARDQNSKLLNTSVNIRGSPDLPDIERLSQGVYQFTDLAVGQYSLDIQAFGFQPLRKSIEIRPMELSVLSLQFETGIAELEGLTVSTSRYMLFASAQFFVDQRAIENLPDIGNDPIRAVHRLPGAAAGGWSARSYFRGGEENETAIYLNGLRLLDPFHVRDYQNVFSSIDARSISGVEAYTGGFPANYGDHMSGMLLLESQLPEAPRHFEFGISVFNTSILTSGHSQNGKFDWLLSARDSNLKYVLNKDVGEPSYNDVFVSLGYNPNVDTRWSFNALRSDDSILVITENAIEEREQSTSDTLNQSFWLTVKSISSS